MPAAETGFQPRNTPAERRAFFDLKRQIGAIPDPTPPPDLSGYATDAELDAKTVPVAGTITAASGWTIQSFETRLARIGSLVIINVVIRNTSGATSAANPIVATIPAGFRPAATCRGFGSIGAVGGLVQVSAGGAVVLVATVTNGVDCAINLTYLAGA